MTLTDVPLAIVRSLVTNRVDDMYSSRDALAGRTGVRRPGPSTQHRARRVPDAMQALVTDPKPAAMRPLDLDAQAASVSSMAVLRNGPFQTDPTDEVGVWRSFAP